MTDSCERKYDAFSGKCTCTRCLFVEAKIHMSNAKSVQANKAGQKFDSGKTRFTLLVWKFIELMADVMTYGAKQYAEDDWKKVPEARKRYTDALIRHLMKRLGGELIDTCTCGSSEQHLKHDGHSGSTGKPHLACVAVNSMFLWWFDDNESAKP